MKRALLKLIATFVVTVLLMAIQKPLFMAVYHSTINPAGIADWFAVIAHGLALDCSIAGYISVIPAILIIASLCTRSAVVDTIWRIYFIVVAAILSLIFVADMALYGYWGFRLDMTPVFYFTSSPASALASAEWWMLILAPVAWAAVGAAIYLVYRHTVMTITVPRPDGRRRSVAIALMTIATALLFIPIRGGITVSTMNLSTAYFSSNQRLNHAAINPAFSLMYSATHQSDFASQFQFYDSRRLNDIMSGLTHTGSRSSAPDTTLLATATPDVYIIILESFSSHLMPALGGENIATGLDSIARSGILFTQCYASSFRTDRALPAILSGFPGQPTTSVMKYVEKAEHLPSIAASLKEAGYSTAYYYGGDINFTNMLAYLVNSRFDTIVRDSDFPVASRVSKWGAHDGALAGRVIDDIKATPPHTAPLMRVIQTSSSHEPFDVPYSNPRFTSDPALNAFAYADSCVTALVNAINSSPRGARSLIVIVPDHYGVYPRDITDESARHHIPLIITGGALRRSRFTVDDIAAQTDIAATLLGLLGLDHSRFTFSKDLFDPAAPRSAFFSSPGYIGYKDVNNTLIYNIDTNLPVTDMSAGDTTAVTPAAKAVLQSLYLTLSRL